MKIYIAILLLLLPLPVLAAGVEATPAKLMASVRPGKNKGLSLTVKNPSNDVQLFEIYPDDYSDAIRISPASFTLEAGAGRNVDIAIDAEKLKVNSILKTDISVVSKPLAAARLQANAGIKIPLTISLEKKTGNKWATVYLLLAASVLGTMIFSIRRF